MKTLLLVAASTLLSGAQASAQGPALPNRPIARREVIAGVHRQFAAMDANHDGIVTRAEFEAYRARTAGAASANPFEHVGGHWFEHADAAGDGRVTFAEAQARPLQMFDMADADHDGIVSLQEQKMAMMMMSLRGK